MKRLQPFPDLMKQRQRRSRDDMGFTTHIKDNVNRMLRGVNLKVDTLTADRIAMRRLMDLERAGHFSEPVFALPQPLQRMDPAELLDDG